MIDALLQFDWQLLWLCCVPAFFWEGCPCCGTCEITTDDFDRADDTDIDTGSSAGWTETAGSWEIVSNTLRTASSSAKATCDTTHPDAVPSHYVSVTVYGADTDQLRVHVGDHYAQLTIGSPNGCLALYTSGGTLLTKMRVDVAATTIHTLKVWYGLTEHDPTDESQFAAQVNSETVLRYVVTRNGNSVALGTGTIGSTVRFGDFIYEKHWTATDLSCKQSARPCAIFSDTFTRADDADPGCSWTEVSGTSAITSNKLAFTAAGIAICNVVHPANESTMLVQVDFTHDTSTSICDVLIAVVDSSNYYYVRFTVAGASGSVAIRRNNAGVHTTLASQTGVTINTSTTYTALVCMTDSGVIWVGGVPSVFLAAQTPATPTGAQAGVGCSGSGTATFDNFAVTATYHETVDSTCQKCFSTCVRCDNDVAPSTLKVVVTGIANGTCGTCAGLDGTYYLPFREANAAYCIWRQDSISTECALNWRVFAYLDLVASDELIIDFDQTTDIILPANQARFRLDAVDHDCFQWTDLDIPFVSDGTYCDWSGATCEVTALI